MNEAFSQNIQNETITFVEPLCKFSINYFSNWESISPGLSFQEGNLDLIIQKP
jgi:hypothetical protein